MARQADFAARIVTWAETSDPFFPYEAQVGGERWVLRLNDWPDEPSLYTLFVGSQAVLELQAWPAAWNRPQGKR